MIKLFLANGFEEIEALATLDILRRAGLRVVTVGVGKTEIKGAHGIVVRADCSEKEQPAGHAEMIILPGGMPGAKNLAESERVSSAVKKAMETGAFIGAICAAPGVVLSKLGALKGRRWTCYPGYETGEGEYTAERCVTDGNLITANGPGAAFLFACELLRAIDPEKYEAAAREFLQK